MSIEALVAPLLRVRLFQGLDPIQLTAIARMAERVMFREGQIMAEAGASAEASIVVVSGPAESFGATPDDREFVAPGSVIGEMAMFIEHVFGTSVIARGPVKALRFSRESMHQLMLEDPAIAEHLVGKISARLTQVADELRRIDDGIEQRQRSLASAFDALPPPVIPPDYGPSSLGVH